MIDTARTTPTTIRRSPGVEEIEHVIGRYTHRDAVQVSAGGAGTLVTPQPAAGTRWIIDRVSMVDDAGNAAPGGSNAPRLYLSTPNAADAFVGTVTGIGGGNVSYAFQPIRLEAGQTLNAVLAGWGASSWVGWNIGYALVELEYRQWRRTPDADEGAGFPSVPDVEAGTPSYDTPDAQDLRDRDPEPLDAPGAHRDRPTGYGRGALYPDRPADASAPAAFPWPDGPAIPGGDY